MKGVFFMAGEIPPFFLRRRLVSRFFAKNINTFIEINSVEVGRELGLSQKVSSDDLIAQCQNSISIGILQGFLVELSSKLAYNFLIRTLPRVTERLVLREFD